MLKQSVSRNQRSKGFKVKNVVQICVLIVVCVWLLYQLKHSYDKNKKAYYDDDDDDKKLTENVPGTGNNVLKLGRKGIVDPRVDGRAFVDERRVEGGKEEEDDDDEDDESRVERNEDEGRGGGGEDELDGHDQDGAEEEEYGGVEDFIDEADKESEDKEVEMNLQEEQYKEDDESSAVDHGTRTLGIGTETIGLRKVKVEENSEKSESEQRNETEWVLTKWWEKEKKNVVSASRNG